MIPTETIVALATPSGAGAIAIIRLSGKDSISFADKIFVSVSGKELIKQKTHTIHLGHIVDNGKTYDQVLVSVFKNPHSYTGEDVVEISCHGSTFIQQQIIQLLLRKGATMAKAGEFTLRAFLNGKLDLSQAEAVADLIASDNEASHQIAMQQMRGGFSNEIAKLREELLNFASLIELELDFAEEDVEFADRTAFHDLVERIEFVLKRLIDSFAVGNVIKNGIPVAIVGEPNVGKSTLLNALLNEERAIVSDIAGTTRDTIEDELVINGIGFRFIDTAGIRKKAKVTEDIEYYSVLRSVGAIENSDVCIFMIDAKEGLQKQDLHIYYIIEKNSKGVVVLVNKWDLVEKDQNTMVKYEEQLRNELAPFNDVPIIFTSTITKQRIHKALEATMMVHENRTKKIPTSKLNDVMLEVIQQNPPPALKGKYIRIKFVQQLPTHAPAFAFFCNLPQYIPDSYKRFLENRMREHFDFCGVPIKIFFRKK